jgi:hypothetical protein
MPTTVAGSSPPEELVEGLPHDPHAADPDLAPEQVPVGDAMIVGVGGRHGLATP